MTLQAAATAKTGSDSNRAAPDVSNLTIVAIDAQITVNKGRGEYTYNSDYVGRIQSDVLEIKQSDNSYISLETIIYALEENGYRTSDNKKNTSTGFKINLSVAWS